MAPVAGRRSAAWKQNGPSRRRLALRLERVFRPATETGHLARFIVFGSFVTTKGEPDDVDVFMIMDDDFDVAVLNRESRLLFDRVQHGMAGTHAECLCPVDPRLGRRRWSENLADRLVSAPSTEASAETRHAGYDPRQRQDNTLQTRAPET